MCRSSRSTRTELKPVTNVGTGVQVMAVRKPAGQQIPEFVAHAKANPGKLNFAIAGANNLSHLAPVLLFKLAGVELTMMPSRGEPQAIADLVAGNVDFYFGNASILLEQAKPAGSSCWRSALRSACRCTGPADGVRNLSGLRLRVVERLYGADGTPPDVIGKFRAAVIAIVKTPQMSERLGTQYPSRRAVGGGGRGRLRARSHQLCGSGEGGGHSGALMLSFVAATGMSSARMKSAAIRPRFENADRREDVESDWCGFGRTSSTPARVKKVHAKREIKQHVIVVGAGPVGLVTANLLVDEGIAVSLIETCEDLPRDLRASTFHPPTLDMLERFERCRPDDRAGVDLSDMAIPGSLRRRRRHLELARLSPHTVHPYRLQCEQWRLGELLYARIKDNPLATIQFGTTAVAARQRADGVEAT